jgi:UDP-N-acetylmuramate--alanine ligase
MLEGFADVLMRADDVIVAEVYRARDTDEDARSVRSALLAEAIRRRGTNCFYADSFSRVTGQLEGVVERGAVVVFLGAGDITLLAHEFAQAAVVGQVFVREAAPGFSAAPGPGGVLS